MKLIKKISTSMVIICLLVSTITPIQAAASYQTVVGTEDPGINICLNDLNIVNRDVNGNPVFPVIINGSTYLPVRGVAAAAGLTVGWDQATQTVSLNTDPNADMVEATRAFTEPKIDMDFVKYVSVNEAENNDDFYSPQVLPTLPVQVEGVIDDKDGSKTDKVDFYQFEVSGEALVRFDILSDIQTNATMLVYGFNKDNSSIVSSSSNDFSHRTLTAVLEKGTYLVKVGNSGDQGSYTLKIAELPLELQTGDNEDFEKAYPINLGTKLYSYVKTKDTYDSFNYYDFYSFEVKSTQTILINTVAKDFNNVSLYLYSESKPNSSIASDASDNKTNRFISTVLQPGKYVIKVSGAQSAYYGLLLEGIEATALSSKKITATVRPDINIVINGQAFTPKDAGGNIIYPVIINGSTYLPVRSVAQAVGLNIGWDGSIRTVIMAKNPTDNLLRNVENKFPDSGSVSEAEDNDEFYTAQQIPLVGTLNGTIYDKQNNKTDNVDYYQIEVPYEGQLTVKVEGDSAIKDFSLNISGYNNNNSPIATDSEGSNTTRTVQPYLKAGTYIIKIYGAKATGNYTLTTSFNCPSDQGEDNDSFETATVIDLQSEIDGIINSEDSISGKDYNDFYKVIVFDTGKLNIKLTADRRVNPGIYLYSALKPNSSIESNTSDVEAERNINQAVQPGIYYIKIEHGGDAGTYHLSVSLSK